MTEVAKRVLLEHEWRDTKCACGVEVLDRDEFAGHQAARVVAAIYQPPNS